MKKAMWIIACISLIGTAFMLRFLPESIPMHYDISGNIDRWGSKYEQFIMPAMIFVFALIFELLIRHYEKRAELLTDEKESAEARSNTKVLKIVGLASAIFFSLLNVLLMIEAIETTSSGSTKMTIDFSRVSSALLGFLCIVLGNILPKTRKNSNVGFRLPWSMYNDNTWNRTNRFGGYALVAAGVLSVVTAILVSGAGISLLLTMVWVIAATIVTTVYSYSVYKKEHQ